MKELDEKELKKVEGGEETLPVLKSDGRGTYYEWPDGSWVAVDWLA
ncbi:bacteriocin [Prolixibacter sp. SD074]|nr:bacteriocin [Prolixibacter sp. SD074]GET30046.1 hypothetical protein SD074_22480 [Prolixibacter sp. SD074]